MEFSNVFSTLLQEADSSSSVWILTATRPGNFRCILPFILRVRFNSFSPAVHFDRIPSLGSISFPFLRASFICLSLFSNEPVNGTLSLYLGSTPGLIDSTAFLASKLCDSFKRAAGEFFLNDGNGYSLEEGHMPDCKAAITRVNETMVEIAMTVTFFSTFSCIFPFFFDSAILNFHGLDDGHKHSNQDGSDSIIAIIVVVASLIIIAFSCSSMAMIFMLYRESRRLRRQGERNEAMEIRIGISQKNENFHL